MFQINRFEEFSQHSVVHKNAHCKDKDKDMSVILFRKILYCIYTECVNEITRKTSDGKGQTRLSNVLFAISHFQLRKRHHLLISCSEKFRFNTFTKLNAFTISDKTVSVSCVARSSVELPCNLTSPLAEDQVRLVLWFKNDSAKPIYTYDTRGTTQYKINPKQSSHSLEQLQLTSSPWQDHGQNRGASYILYLPFLANVQLLQTSVTNVTTVFRIPLVCVHRSFCCQRNNIAWPSPQSLPWNKWDTGTARARLDCSGRS